MQSATSGMDQAAQAGERERFSAAELAIVLSHYGIGVIESIAKFPRGSRRAPKLLITSEQGKFLLKRRAHGKDDAQRVAFSHSLQMHLAAKQFPLPHLIGTRTDNNSMLEWQGGVYELFEYIPGQAYPHTLEATFDAGRVLALYHKLLEDFQSEFQPAVGSYHNHPAIEQGLAAVPAALPTAGEALPPLLQFLRDSYVEAAGIVEEAGIGGWPRQYVHGDWHPGNMLFRENHVVAVIDYDSARVLPRIIDTANGALQFSITMTEEDAAKWPDYVDESRFKRFVRGYDEVVLLSDAEVRVMPHLMVEALVAEAVLPIAVCGAFGHVDGLAFLQMVQRKVRWLREKAHDLVELVGA